MLLPAAVPQPAPPLHLLLGARESPALLPSSSGAAAAPARRCCAHRQQAACWPAGAACCAAALRAARVWGSQPVDRQCCHAHCDKKTNVALLAQVAVFYVNKLRVAGIQAEPLNLHFEQIFEVGVDEVSWMLGCSSAAEVAPWLLPLLRPPPPPPLHQASEPLATPSPRRRCRGTTCPRMTCCGPRCGRSSSTAARCVRACLLAGWLAGLPACTGFLLSYVQR